MSRYPGKVRAPGFPQSGEWINSRDPLTLTQLRGKIVLLDFWTYCCINCLHILPDLKLLERRYSREICVVGVHSAKFPAERSSESVRQAVRRLGIEHPVINDPTMSMWREYGVRVWPTVVVIDPEGKVVGVRQGEGVFDALDPVIRELIEEFDGKGTLNRAPLEIMRVPRPLRTVLAYPGKVLADGESDRLFIADSGHHRIVLSRLNGEITDVIGSGECGFSNGAFADATFNNPQGLALRGTSLYIADTDNHAIRRADLVNRCVETVAGSGYQSRDRLPTQVPAFRSDLNSPWDIAFLGDTLYIAMAGAHQLWTLDLPSQSIGPAAGSGVEGLVDGLSGMSALAQPSGITTDGRRVYFVDSETSSARAFDPSTGAVETIVGTGLFDYGDRDGFGDAVLLQHPLGIAWHDGVLWVADTYNNKVKRIFPTSAAALTVAGGFEAGWRDGETGRALLNQPGGLSACGDRLFVADTNNHAIRVIDLPCGNTRTLDFSNLRALQRTRNAPWIGEIVDMPLQRVAHGPVSFTVTLQLPAGATLSMKWRGLVRTPVEQQLIEAADTDAKVTLRVDARMEVCVLSEVFYCRPEPALCYFSEFMLVVPVEPADDGSDRVTITHTLEG